MKRITIIVISLFMSINIFAQQDTEWRFGLKGAPSMAWFWPDTQGLDYNHDIGFSYGIIGDKYFTENYAVTSGLFVTHQGGELDFTKTSPGGEDYDNREYQLYDLQYLEVPAAIKMRTREFGYWTFFGQFGISLGYNTRARADIEYANNTTPEKGVHIDDEIRPMKASLLMGLGAEFSLLGNTAIFMGLNYNNGFSDVLDDIEGDYISARASYAELTIGMMF